MKSHAVLLLALLLVKLSVASLVKVCDEYKSKLKYEFHPLRHCQRSNGTVIAQMNVDTVKQCASHARSHKGLAFNFSPKSRRKTNFFDVEANKNDTKKDSSSKSQEVQRDFYSCEVLACPETRNYSSIVNDTRFDYYTMYAYPARKYFH